MLYINSFAVPLTVRAVPGEAVTALTRPRMLKAMMAQDAGDREEC